MIKIFLVLVVAIISLSITVYCLIKTINKYKADCKTLENQNQKQIDNLKNLALYIKELTSIENTKSETEKRIKEVTTDEEVNNIVSDIISNNNNRVQKSTEK